MDRKELESKLQVFQAQCAAQDHPIKEITLEEAYPGIDSTSFIVRFSAAGNWFAQSQEDRASLLERFVDILWESTDQTTRKAIFTLSLNDEKQAGIAA
ncbi:MAG: hypothetical protein PHU14_03625 [Methylovulum sp.]|nr:hypothetical protein [Methylovulum sp.]